MNIYAATFQNHVILFAGAYPIRPKNHLTENRNGVRHLCEAIDTLYY